MVTQRIFNTRLLIYLLISHFSYLFTYFLFTYLVTIYSFIYLFSHWENFVRATMTKPRGRSVAVSSCTMQCRRLLNTMQF